MKINARKVENDSTFEYDVCIVGAGAAGIALALQLKQSNLSVALIESGGFQYNATTQSLYEGQAEGTVLPEDNNYLVSTRFRSFGGTTHLWNGVCRPLDSLDFKKRPWIAESGWPISKGDLAPYYKAAEQFLQVPSFDEGRDEGNGWDSEEVFVKGKSFVNKHFRLSPPARVGTIYKNDIQKAENITLFLNANITAVEVEETGSRATHVQVATINKRQFKVKAGMFVLAAGGIETVRILLNSDRVHKGGLGNENDMVGRYFMEHPHFQKAGQVVMTNPPSKLDQYRFELAQKRKSKGLAVVVLSEAAQQKHQLLNTSIQLDRIASDPPSEPTMKTGYGVSEINKLEPVNRKHDLRFAQFFVRAEQLPNRESRITLLPEVDSLGMRQVHLDWRVKVEDVKSIQKVVDLLCHEVGFSSRGRGQQLIRSEHLFKGGRFGSHHMGTTRMSFDSSTGVVDQNCRLHSVSNVYIASSSVFPTVGYANPTLTIVALACRLGEHLREVLKA